MSGLDRLTGDLPLKEAALIRHWASSTGFAYDSGISTIDEHDDQRKPLPRRDDFDLFWSSSTGTRTSGPSREPRTMSLGAHGISDLADGALPGRTQGRLGLR